MDLDELPFIEEAILLVPRHCPNRCGEQIVGKRMELHLEEECPLRRQICPEGCGDRILGSDMEEHRQKCPMAKYLGRAEAALRESSMREFRLAYDGILEERELARARFLARGEKDTWGKSGWPSNRCRVRVLTIDSESRALLSRSRRRAAERLAESITEAAAAGGMEDKSPEKGPTNALKYWDAIAAENPDRAARPWDLDTPALLNLRNTLDEAAIAGADVRVRQKGEAMFLSLLRRILTSASETHEDRARILAEAAHRVRECLRYFEILDPSELYPLLEEMDEGCFKESLQNISSSPPEFFEALIQGDVDLCEWFLCREQANPGLPNPNNSLSPLLLATKAGDVPMCRLLLKYSANVNDRCSIDGCSALHWAAHHRYFRVMELLLEANANPRLQDKRGQDSLMKLVRRDFASPASGCSCSWRTLQGRRFEGRELPASGWLTLESAKAAAEDDPQCSGFCYRTDEEAYAGEDGRWFISLLAGPAPKSQADATHEDANDGESWTSWIKVDIDAIHDIRHLLSCSADPTAADSSGLTALHHHLRSAPSRGDLAAVGELLRGGADVNVRDIERGQSAFTLAILAKRSDVVKLMLADAFPSPDLDAPTPDGTSPLGLAESVGAHLVSQLLREAGASAWTNVECRLGARTAFSWDSRSPPAMT